MVPIDSENGSSEPRRTSEGSDLSRRSQDAETERASSHRRIRLRRGGALVLEPEGYRVLEPRGKSRPPLSSYEAITHVSVADRALLIGTETGLEIIRSQDFLDPESGPDEAKDALLGGLAARPDGEFGLARHERLEAFSERPVRYWAIWAVAALSLFASVAVFRDTMIYTFGSFASEFFRRGEIWRAVTAHFLHGSPSAPLTIPIHLAVNVAGLLVLGHLLERPLGHVRTIVILVAGGVGTIAGSLYYGYQDVVGASGLVSALAGALLALELHYPAALPVYSRLPRRIFIWALVLQFLVIDQLFASYLAGGAHLGGFAGGYWAGWFVGAPRLDNRDPSPAAKMIAWGGVAALAAGLLLAAPLMQHEPDALERHALRLLNTAPPTDGVAVQHHNAVAWFLATEGDPSPTGQDLSVALADRAVMATQRLNPNILDTLAESLFQAGDRLGALITIDEAIYLAPNESYFREQRKRFTGERAEDDRPSEPGEGFDVTPEIPEEGEPNALPFDPDAPAITL